MDLEMGVAVRLRILPYRVAEEGRLKRRERRERRGRRGRTEEGRRAGGVGGREERAAAWLDGVAWILCRVEGEEEIEPRRHEGHEDRNEGEGCRVAGRAWFGLGAR